MQRDMATEERVKDWQSKKRMFGYRTHAHIKMGSDMLYRAGWGLKQQRSTGYCDGFFR